MLVIIEVNETGKKAHELVDAIKNFLSDAPCDAVIVGVTQSKQDEMAVRSNILILAGVMEDEG